MGISFQNDYSFLFGNATNTTTGNTFSLSDYAMIKSGTYKKLMKAYYANTDNSFVNSVAGSKAASKDDTVQIKKLQETSSALSDSAKALYSEKGKKLFDEEKRDDLVKAVSTLVKDYNSMVDAANSSDNDKILRAGSSMLNSTVANYKLLSSVGISIGSDNKLSLDEDTLKKAGASAVKSVFSGVGSFAYKVDTSASYINSYAKDDALKASGLYGASGSYSAYLQGSTYNSFT